MLHKLAALALVVFAVATDLQPPLPPRESGEFVAKSSKDVRVDEEGVRRVAEMLYALRDSEELTASAWKKANPLAPAPTSEQALNWVFVVDTMNFSFWPEQKEQQCEVTHKGTTYRGYMTLCAAITRAMDEGETAHSRTASSDHTAVHSPLCLSRLCMYSPSATSLTCVGHPRSYGREIGLSPLLSVPMFKPIIK